MNFKYLFLICAVIVQIVEVRCDCDDYLKCFLSEFFGNDENNSTNIKNTDENNYMKIQNEDNDEQNVTIGYLDLTDTENNLKKVLSDVTSLIRDEIEKKLKIEYESDTIEAVDNKTEIYVKTFDLKELPEDFLNKDEVNVENNTENLRSIVNVPVEGLLNTTEIFKFNIGTASNLSISTERTDVEIQPWNLDKILNSFFLPKEEGQDYVTIAPVSTSSDGFNETNISVSNETVDIQVQPLNLDDFLNRFYPTKDQVQNSVTTARSAPILVTNNNNNNNNNENRTLDIPIQPLNIDKILESVFQITDVKQKFVINAPSVITNVNKTIVHENNNTQMKYSEIVNINEYEKDVPKVVTNNGYVTTISPISGIINVNVKKLKGIKNNENIRDNEILIVDEETESYYDEADDNSTDYPIIDYIELYKDTTNEDVTYISTEIPTNIANNINEVKSDLDNIIEYSLVNDELGNENFENNADAYESKCGNGTNNIAQATFPWVATIFIKNGTSNQFDYFCDGALLSERVILTAARCVRFANATLDANNLLIILGRKSLQAATDGERIHKVKQIKIHENFSMEATTAKNDLALLELDDPAIFSYTIQPACLSGEDIGGNSEAGESRQAATSGWGISGQLTPIRFLKEDGDTCKKNDEDANTFCATYGNDVAVCPSYGGLYVARHTNGWYLQGVLTENPTRRGFCIKKTVKYTSLRNYSNWIFETIEKNKD